MNKPRLSAANLSMGFSLLLVVLSLGFGCRSYRQAEQRIVSDLNQALQRTVWQNKDVWLNTDTLQAYARLQEVMDAPVSVSCSTRKFARALSIPQLKGVASLSLHILKKDAPATAVLHDVPAGYVASDTLVWLSTAGTADAAEAADAETEADASCLTLSFRGYARCSAGMIFSLSQQKLPAMLLGAALLCGVFSVFRVRRRAGASGLASDPTSGLASDPALGSASGSASDSTSAPSSGSSSGEIIAFGNLSLSVPEACFYNERRERLKLTPMQYSLMEMFYLSSSHLLPKADICRSLWPGKENAEETLYTLIRRLKPIVEDNSNLKITTDRGRAYGLEVKT